MFPEFDILSQYESRECSELKNRSKVPLLILDDPFLPVFIDWAMAEGCSDLLMFLFMADHFRFASKRREHILTDSMDCIIKRIRELYDFETFDRTTECLLDLLSCGIDMPAAFSSVCHLVWNDFLNRSQRIHKSRVWSTFRKIIVSGFDVDLLSVIGDDHHAAYFRQYLSHSTGDVECLKCWRDAQHVLSAVHVLKASSSTQSSPSSRPSKSVFSTMRSTSLESSGSVTAPPVYTDPYQALKILLECLRKFHTSIVRGTCTGPSKSTRIKLSEAFQNTSSIRQVESTDRSFASDCCEALEGLLMQVRDENYEHLLDRFTAFQDSKEYVALAASVKLQESQAVRTYLTQNAFLREVDSNIIHASGVMSNEYKQVMMGRRFPWRLTGDVMFVCYAEALRTRSLSAVSETHNTDACNVYNGRDNIRKLCLQCSEGIPHDLCDVLPVLAIRTCPDGGYTCWVGVRPSTELKEICMRATSFTDLDDESLVRDMFLFCREAGGYDSESMVTENTQEHDAVVFATSDQVALRCYYQLCALLHASHHSQSSPGDRPVTPMLYVSISSCHVGGDDRWEHTLVATPYPMLNTIRNITSHLSEMSQCDIEKMRVDGVSVPLTLLASDALDANLTSSQWLRRNRDKERAAEFYLTPPAGSVSKASKFNPDFLLLGTIQNMSPKLLATMVTALLSNKSIVVHSISNKSVAECIATVLLAIHPFELVAHRVCQYCGPLGKFRLWKGIPFSASDNPLRQPFLLGLPSDIAMGIVKYQSDHSILPTLNMENMDVSLRNLDPMEQILVDFGSYDLHDVTFFDVDTEQVWTPWDGSASRSVKTLMRSIPPQALKRLEESVLKRQYQYSTGRMKHKQCVSIDSQCNYYIERELKSFINSMILGGVPSSLAHYPQYRIVSCDVKCVMKNCMKSDYFDLPLVGKDRADLTFADRDRIDFLDSVVQSPSFTNFLFRHGVALDCVNSFACRNGSGD